MICPICNGSGSYNVPLKSCFRCKGGTIEVSDLWEEPAVPPIDRIRELAREVGYAIGVHGSEKRDYDIIAAPWTDYAIGNAGFVEHLCKGLNAKMISMMRKPQGRYAFTLQMVEGYYKNIDLSVMPTEKENKYF